MGKKVAASEGTRQRLHELSQGRQEGGDARSQWVRLAPRLIVEEALEAEILDALGWEYYKNSPSHGSGCRNGYRTVRLKSAEGLAPYGAPQVCVRA